VTKKKENSRSCKEGRPPDTVKRKRSPPPKKDKNSKKFRSSKKNLLAGTFFTFASSFLSHGPLSTHTQTHSPLVSNKLLRFFPFPHKTHFHQVFSIYYFDFLLQYHLVLLFTTAHTSLYTDYNSTWTYVYFITHIHTVTRTRPHTHTHTHTHTKRHAFFFLIRLNGILSVFRS